MRSKRIVRIAAAAVISFFLLLFLIIVTAERIVNSAPVKSRIERFISGTFDIAVGIEGRVEIDFIPVLSLAVNNASITIPYGRIASADRIEIQPHLLDLLQQNVHLKKAALHRIRILLDKDAVAALKGRKPKAFPAYKSVRSLSVESFEISNAAFYYADNETVVDLSEMDFTGNRIKIIEDYQVIIGDIVSVLKSVHFAGTVSAREISSRDRELKNIRAKIKDDKGIIRADPLELEISGTKANLRADLDLTKTKPLFTSHIELSELDIAPLAGHFDLKGAFTGKLKIIADISAAGIDIDKIQGLASDADQPVRSAANDVLPIMFVNVDSYTIAGTGLHYSKGTTSINDIELNLSGGPLSVVKDGRAIITGLESFIRATSLKGNAVIKRISARNFEVRQIRANVKLHEGTLTGDPVELDYYGACTILTYLYRIQDNVNDLTVRIEMPYVDLEKLLKEFGREGIIEGKIQVNGEFDARSESIDELPGNANGYFSVKGKNLHLKGVDLEKALDEFEKMQGFGFNDFFATILLGPLGGIVSHGYTQLGALENIMAAKGYSTIQQVVSDWDVAAGTAKAKDVAFSTTRHRVAVKGWIDIPGKRFENLTIAIVDPAGCTLNSETINGPFVKPEIKGGGIIERTVIRPLRKMLEADCELFYSGSVPHPSSDK